MTASTKPQLWQDSSHLCYETCQKILLDDRMQATADTQLIRSVTYTVWSDLLILQTYISLLKGWTGQ